MNQKTLAREFSFQYLFHLQLPLFKKIEHSLLTGSKSSREELIQSITEFKESTNTTLNDNLSPFIIQLIEGTILHTQHLDELISKYIKNWKIDRLPKVDYTILLLAGFELTQTKETPVSVVINEAIELSKKFGTLDSASFVNGVLDNIAKNER